MLALEGPPAPRRRCRHLRLGLRPRRCGALEAKVLVLRLRTSPPPAMASGEMQTLVTACARAPSLRSWRRRIPEGAMELEQCPVAYLELPEELTTDVMEQGPVAYQELPEEPRLRS